MTNVELQEPSFRLLRGLLAVLLDLVFLFREQDGLHHYDANGEFAASVLSDCLGLARDSPANHQKGHEIFGHTDVDALDQEPSR